MDPHAALTDIRMMAKNLLRGTSPHGDAHEGRCLAETITALDDWLSGGGFLPIGWDGPPT